MQGLPLQVWLAALATTAGLLGLVGVALWHRKTKNRWAHIRPAAPRILDARAATLSASRSERLIAPLMDSIADAAQRLFRPQLVREGEALLEQTGPRRFLNGRRLLSIKLMSIPVGAVIGLLLTSGMSTDVRLIAAGVLPLVTWRLPGVYLSSLAKSRSAEITRELPDVLDQVTISVSAGLGLEAAITRVSQRSEGPLAAELNRTMQDIRIGVDRVVAYEGLSRRSSSEDLGAVVASIIQCVEMGTPLAPVLKARAAELRRKRRAAAEEKAHKLSVKLTFPTAICILPSLMMVVMGPTIINIVNGGLGG